MAEHRVSMLSASLRRFEDPARSSDPRIRSLVAQLAAVEPAPAPRAHFRAELRAQLVAVAPRLIAEGPAIETRLPTETASKPLHATKPAKSRLGSAAGWTSRISIARPLAAVTAVVAVFAMLLGGAVWVSKKALPGEALYSLKRANENVALSLAPDDAAKGREYLKLARTRAEEVSALVSRTSSMAGGSGASAAGGLNASTATLISKTLDSADSETRNGAKLLDAAAVRSGSAAPLKALTSWAPTQLARLQSIADRVGSGAVHDRVAASSTVTSQAFSRAKALHADLGCDCLDRSTTDELGPMPCTSGCSTAPHPAKQSTAPTKTKQPAKTSSNSPTVTGSGSNSTTGTVPLNPTVSSVPSTSDGSVTIPLPITLPPITLPGQQSPSTTPNTDASSTHTCTVNLLGICIGEVS
jgi:hypothetical protein